MNAITAIDYLTSNKLVGKTVYDINTYRIIYNADDKDYNLTKDSYYWVIAILLTAEESEPISEKIESLYYYIKNDLGIIAKYSAKLFNDNVYTPTAVLINNTARCSSCSCYKPKNILNTQNVCINCLSKKRYCTVCKTKEVTIIEGVCNDCKAKLTFTKCSICDKQVLAKEQELIKNTPYNPIAFPFEWDIGYINKMPLCQSCKNEGFDKYYDDIFTDSMGNSPRLFEIAYDESTYNLISPRTFGVEFEVVSKKDYLRPTCLKVYNELSNIKTRRKNTLADYLRAVHDGSITDSDIRGVELITTILRGDTGLDYLSKIISILDNHFYTDNSCGLHIHIGVQDFSDEEVVELYHLYERMEKYFPLFVRRDRLNNDYCKPLEHNPLQFYKTPITKHNPSSKEKYASYKSLKRRPNKYCAVNLLSLDEHNTIEIRVMEGNLNTEKIIDWIKFNVAIVDFAKKHSDLVSSKELIIKDIIGKELSDKYFNDGIKNIIVDIEED